MKNSLIESLRKIRRRSGNSICARLTPSRIIIGVLSITLLLCSLFIAIAELTGQAIAATASTGGNSVTKRILVPIDTSTLVITITIPIIPDPTMVTPTPTPTMVTPTPTPTMVTPTPTPTMATPTPTPTRVRPTPTPTMAITPTPTSTTTNSPSPTNTPTSSPRVTTTTSSSSSSSSYVPPGITPTATAIVTPGTTITDTGVVSTPDSSQGKTQATLPTNNSVQSIGQEQKKNNFPFTQLIIGLLGSAVAIYLVFIGRLYLNNRMQVKSSSSGAYSWSGELTNNMPWDINQNGNYAPSDGMDSATNAYNDSGSFAPPNWNYSPMNNDPAYVPPSTPHPELFESQAMGMGNNSHERGAGEQWSDNNPEGYVDFNDPYLQGLLKEYSEKSNDAGQQRDVDSMG